MFLSFLHSSHYIDVHYNCHPYRISQSGMDVFSLLDNFFKSCRCKQASKTLMLMKQILMRGGQLNVTIQWFLPNSNLKNTSNIQKRCSGHFVGGIPRFNPTWQALLGRVLHVVFQAPSYPNLWFKVEIAILVTLMSMRSLSSKATNFVPSGS